MRRNYRAFIQINVKNLINLIARLRFAVFEFFDPVPSVGSIICLRRLRQICRSSFATIRGREKSKFIMITIRSAFKISEAFQYIILLSLV